MVELSSLAVVGLRAEPLSAVRVTYPFRMSTWEILQLPKWNFKLNVVFEILMSEYVVKGSNHTYFVEIIKSKFKESCELEISFYKRINEANLKIVQMTIS